MLSVFCLGYSKFSCWSQLAKHTIYNKRIINKSLVNYFTCKTVQKPKDRSKPQQPRFNNSYPMQ
ncbi:hypothetical protein Hanom_Chr07g00664411 [Helianthus anomalus]